MGTYSVSEPVLDNSATDREGISDRKASSALHSIFISSPTHIWRSKISWRIALTAFMTILLVQTLVLNLGGIEQYRQEQLTALTNEARSALSSIIDPKKRDTRKPPFEDRHVKRLLQTTNVTGLTVYSYQYDFIQSYGASTHLVAVVNMLDKTYESADGAAYEVVFRGADIRSTFLVVARMDSSDIDARVSSYVLQNIKIMVILSLLVTTVLMIALGKWLL